MDNAKENMIDNFVNITGVDNDRAKFYLESSNWNLELAVASFYEGDGDDDMGDVPSAPPPEVRADPGPGPTGSSGRPGQSKSSRFATVSSLRAGDQSESSSEDEGQAFYAGGSERSGQQILGPKKNKKNIVEDLFKSAKDHGAEEVDKPEASVPRKKPTFRGAGYRLGDQEEGDTEVVQGENVPERRKKVDCVLKLWKDGFSVDNGPLRDFRDPANAEFLESIKNGQVPRELIRQAKGGEVNLNMEDHRTEDYVKPKEALKAFTGEGHTLGSPAPAVVFNTAPATGKGGATKPQAVAVDESKPTTSLQIRLADGSRLVAKFNHTHQVRDIRNFVVSSRPQYDGVNFILQTTFPNKELTDDSQTLEDGKLLNAVIVQRLK